MLAHVGKLALARGRHVRIDFAPTARNEPAKKFLLEHKLLPQGGEDTATGEPMTSEVFPAAAVAEVKLDTSKEMQSSAAAAEGSDSKKLQAASIGASRAEAFHAVAKHCVAMADAAGRHATPQHEMAYDSHALAVASAGPSGRHSRSTTTSTLP